MTLGTELTPAERERLYLIVEECGEVIKEAAKILRFGYDANGYSNRACLTQELGDIMAVKDLMVEKGDVASVELDKAKSAKREKLTRYTRFQ